MNFIWAEGRATLECECAGTNRQVVGMRDPTEKERLYSDLECGPECAERAGKEEEPFTALMHHVTVSLPGRAFQSAWSPMTTGMHMADLVEVDRFGPEPVAPRHKFEPRLNNK
jgi:hypothetical protein